MSLRRESIDPAHAAPAVRQLYESAFPAEEQIPWPDLLRLVHEMPLDFAAYYDAATFVGLTVVYPRPGLHWFWYFAVRADLRGRGYGQQILTRLIGEHADAPLILDMESPAQQPCDNLAQRRRRHAFYLRNGFRDTGVGRTFDGIAYTIMMRGEGTFTLRDYDAILADLRRHWAGVPDVPEAEKP